MLSPKPQLKNIRETWLKQVVNFAELFITKTIVFNYQGPGFRKELPTSEAFAALSK